MRICSTGTSSMTSTSGRVPDPRPGEGQLRRPAAHRGVRVVRGGSPSPDVVLVAAGREVAVAMAVAELLVHDGVATRVVAVASGQRADSVERHEIDGVAPPGLPRVTVCGDGCPETLEGIRLSAHDAIAAGTQGW